MNGNLDFARLCAWLLCGGIGFAACVAGPVSSAEPAPAALDILVVAPHSDDEAIGCAATMLAAIEAGKRVGVVIVTNGDGFPKAAAAIAKKPESQLAPADFIALTGIRQQHSIGAMAHVGLKAEDLIFLGYPDGVLSQVYETEGNVPIRSKFTQKNETYGAVVPDYHSRAHGRPAPCVKASVVGDLVEILRARKPQEIYVTHEADPPVPGDHQVTFCFVRDAARAAGWRGTLWTYFVHSQAPASLAPPERRLTLGKVQFKKKRALLEEYQVKMSPVHDRLAEKFTQPEELFWPIRID